MTLQGFMDRFLFKDLWAMMLMAGRRLKSCRCQRLMGNLRITELSFLLDD